MTAPFLKILLDTVLSFCMFILSSVSKPRREHLATDHSWTLSIASGF